MGDRPCHFPAASRRAAAPIGRGRDNLSYGKRCKAATLAVVRVAGARFTNRPREDRSLLGRCVMRMRWLVAAVPIMLIGADAPKDDAAKKELEKFQGTWQLVSAETDGKTTPDEQVKKTRIVI